MILWIIAGLIVWILCVSLMLVIIKGGHSVRGNRYEQKLCSRSMVKTQNIKDSIKKGVKKVARIRKSQGPLISKVAY
ncbi:MAG: hypothetical protein GY775_13270 [Candidatus Scalindua sp.]|nr:hypothetical protein [Candidatus Scalindua sp.]